MTGALLAVALSLVAGWGAWRRHARLAGAPDAISGTVLWGAAITGCWLTLLELTGVPWSMPLLLVPAAGGAALGLSAGVLRRPRFATAQLDLWKLVTCSAVAARAAWVAVAPAFGWDFRYIWGLKGRTFALARGLDWGWLAWRGHAFAHPDYPPLWPDLLAAGRVTGGSVAAAAALWQAALVVGLAAVAWRLCAGARRPVRAMAGVAAAWSPVLFSPLYSGYADALVAFALAAAVAALLELRTSAPGPMVTLLVAVPVLAMAKNEGMVLAGGVAVAAFVVGPWRNARWPALALVVPVAGWRIALGLHGVVGEGLVLAPATLLGRLGTLPAALVTAATPVLVAVAAALALAVGGLRGRAARGPAIVFAVWAAGVACAYLTTPYDLTWHLANSLDRVLAVPLPAAIAVALATRPSERSGVPPAPGSAPGG